MSKPDDSGFVCACRVMKVMGVHPCRPEGRIRYRKAVLRSGYSNSEAAALLVSAYSGLGSLESSSDPGFLSLACCGPANFIYPSFLELVSKQWLHFSTPHVFETFQPILRISPPDSSKETGKDRGSEFTSQSWQSAFPSSAKQVTLLQEKLRHERAPPLS